jgi:hypothetical protein
MINLKDIELVNTNKDLYSSFNEFILSDDTKIFNKLIMRSLLVDKVKNVPGDIVECGVFKGTGLLTFLKLKNLLMPNSYKKIIGFDYFNSDELLQSLCGQDKEAMEVLFKQRNFEHNISFAAELNKKIISYGFKQENFELVSGDVSYSTKNFIKDKPGFKISLLYMDLDLDLPTYDVLCNFWDKISLNGIVVFDEYAYHNWSESKGVDRFFKDKNIKMTSLNCLCPTMYIEKETI